MAMATARGRRPITTEIRRWAPMVGRNSPVPRRGRRQQSPTTAVDAASPAVATVSGAAT